MVKVNWSLEPGDGTGNSIQDAHVRNEKGICSILGCSKNTKDDAISYGLMQKLCPECEIEHLKCIEKFIKNTLIERVN